MNDKQPDFLGTRYCPVCSAPRTHQVKVDLPLAPLTFWCGCGAIYHTDGASSTVIALVREHPTGAEIQEHAATTIERWWENISLDKEIARG